MTKNARRTMQNFNKCTYMYLTSSGIIMCYFSKCTAVHCQALRQLTYGWIHHLVGVEGELHFFDKFTSKHIGQDMKDRTYGVFDGIM